MTHTERRPYRQHADRRGYRAREAGPRDRHQRAPVSPATNGGTHNGANTSHPGAFPDLHNIDDVTSDEDSPRPGKAATIFIMTRPVDVVPPCR